MLYRELLRDSLDRIFEQKYDHMKDCIESKVFGIGLESYTVGSNDFYIGYGASRGKIVTLDTGHFHPTELVADKLVAAALHARGDAPRLASRALGFGPRDDHERRYVGAVQGDRALRRAR